ncbi:hypothetical protein E2C01_064203 [Portunus trituberculatus]|uniref:Uncharacterized protein n=1 Tax=Portunus trituberculatus TaxID=210409 RepID=A0A5B7HCF5_PORTR|nr:hypothetical protein [Portunus trituberculatus]
MLSILEAFTRTCCCRGGPMAGCPSLSLLKAENKHIKPKQNNLTVPQLVLTPLQKSMGKE